MQKEPTPTNLEDLPLGSQVNAELERIHKIFLKYTEKDASVTRHDTAEIIVDLLGKTQSALQKIIDHGEEAREKLFWVLYNGSIQIFTYCRLLREASHQQKAIEGLAFVIGMLDGNLILMKAKYLEWRIKIYAELAGVYEDLGAAVAAKNVIARGQKQVQYLSELEEQDPPIPESTSKSIYNAQRVLNALELKYGLQSGQLKPVDWKKKVQDYFNEDKPALSIAVIESLTTSVRQVAAVVGNKKIIPPWLPEATKYAVELLESDINTVSKALQEQVERKEREKQKVEEIEKAMEAQAKADKEAKEAAEKEALEAAKAEQEKKESKKEAKKEAKKAPAKETAKGKGKEEEKKEKFVTVDEVVEKYKEMDAQMIHDTIWKQASLNVPFEIHVELIKICFVAGLHDLVDKLTESAYIRLKYRRIEVPYVTSIDILASIQKDPIVPNGYDTIPEDLNALHLKQELTKLRATQKSVTITDDAPKDTKKKKEEKKKVEAKKEEKKKEEKKKEEKKKASKKEEKKLPPPEEKKEIATEYELSQIKHTYIRLIVERNKNPTNALCGLTVAFGDPQIGIKTNSVNETAVVIPINKGDDQEIPNRLPFILFKRTANALKDEDEQLSLITDIKVLVSKDPFLMAPPGYIKIPIDIRENPTELLGLNQREYIYLAYKTERNFRLAERDIEVIKNLMELERSFLNDGESEEFKALPKSQKELKLTFDIEQLLLLGNIIRDSILGPIGDLYLVERQDMMFDIISHLWKKYVEPVLKAIDYINELDAHGELLDYLAGDIKELAEKSVKSLSVLVLASHRILNKLKLIDPLLFAEISLETGLIYEHLQDYRTAVQVLRSSMSRVVEWRENAMKVSADGSENWISPMYITTNNYFIEDIEKKIHKAVEDWTDAVLREERQKQRKSEHKALLEQDEADHEFYDIKELTARTSDSSLSSEDLKDNKKQLEEDIKKHQKRFYSDLEGLLASLHCDMLVCLYRSELKLGRTMEGVKNATTRVLKSEGIEAPDITKGVSMGLKAKMTIGNGATAKKIKNDQKYLQTTLHEAGKLRILNLV